ncbi:MAG: hypothetical protein HUU34_00990 [Saprospiraceae bacterium]|nr:hypothetical protein [Saprospiraceae bacterium]
MASLPLRIFGIRHHGPGSARRLLHALEHYQPDCLVLEAPADAQSACELLSHIALTPPVALLMYNADQIRQALYFPFADFSPEWQALLWAYRQGTAVRLMDLPAAHQLAMADDQSGNQLVLPSPTAAADTLRIAADPLGYLAALAGYSDSERWWEATFEQQQDDIALFEGIQAMMRALREAVGSLDHPHHLLREAYMRKVIRQAMADGFSRIAVVCGAWHGPVLEDVASYKTSTDNALLKGLPKVKVNAAWIPWSYDRLALQSGYGAGITSPAWYELIFDHHRDAVIQWMTRVSSLMRHEGLDASPAHALDAVQLAQSLAAMRGLALPGLAELEEAALAVFCGGNDAPLELIRQALVVGKKVGIIPPEVPAIPLQRDLEQQLKTARLAKYWGDTDVQWLKATATNPQGGIDLREETDLLKSKILHRLLLLGIDWGDLQENPDTALGSFKEFWKLRWRPDFAIQLIEAGMWGNTVYAAALAHLLYQAEGPIHLPEATRLVRDALRADLPEIIDPLINRMQGLAALTRDVYYLLESLPTLVSVIQYGDARRTDVSAMRLLSDELIPRACLGLPAICSQIEEEVARDYFRIFLAVNHAIGVLRHDEHTDYWQTALQQVAMLPGAHPLLQGFATRLLFDKGVWSLDYTGQRLHFALSSGQSALYVAYWIEGFLHGSGLLLLHHPGLWQLLDDWLCELPLDTFNEILPLLRRTFSNFSPPERQKMLHLAQHGAPAGATSASAHAMDEDRLEKVLTTVRELMGFGKPSSPSSIL